MLIDLAYSFAMVSIFWLLFDSLPGEVSIVKGISFGLMAWLFRVVMNSLSNWVMFDVPFKTSLYFIVAGLFEMLILGIFFGMTIKV